MTVTGSKNENRYEVEVRTRGTNQNIIRARTSNVPGIREAKKSGPKNLMEFCDHFYLKLCRLIRHSIHLHALGIQFHWPNGRTHALQQWCRYACTLLRSKIFNENYLALRAFSWRNLFPDQMLLYWLCLLLSPIEKHTVLSRIGQFSIKTTWQEYNNTLPFLKSVNPFAFNCHNNSTMIISPPYFTDEETKVQTG